MGKSSLPATLSVRASTRLFCAGPTGRLKLSDTVAPSVADAHAHTQLLQVVAVLRSMDAEDARAAVEARDAAIRPVLDACAEWVQSDESRVAQFGVIAPIRVDITDCYESNRAVLETFIASLEQWRAAHGTATSDEIHHLIGAHLVGRTTP